MSKRAYSIVRLYIKSASIEVPDMSGVPQLAVQPDIGVDFQTDVQPAWARHIECVLTISLHGKLNGKTMFMIEVGQAGIFQVTPFNNEEIARFAKHTAAEVLFPYARGHLAAFAVSAGFQPIVLDHVDFGALLDSVAHRSKATSPAPAANKRLEHLAVAGAEQNTEPAQAPGPRRPAPVDPPAAPDPRAMSAAPATYSAGSVATSQQADAPPPEKAALARIAATRTQARLALSVIVLVAAAGGIWRWSGDSALVVETPPARVATIPILRGPDRQELLKRGEQIIAASRARIADQAESAFTLELGTVSAPDALPALEGLPTQRALLIDRRADGALAILYGIFPSAALAEAAAAELPEPLPAVVTRRTRVLRLGEVRQTIRP